MDRWKSRGGKRQRREEKRNEEKIREEERRCRCAKKSKKSRNTAFFHWFVAPEGRKVGSLKWRVRRHLGRWEMKNCTLLWREAHFEVKTYERNQRRNTFWKLWCGKVHAVVAQSACGRQKCKKTHSLRLLLEVAMMKKCTPLWHKAHFEVKIDKTH